MSKLQIFCMPSQSSDCSIPLATTACLWLCQPISVHCTQALLQKLKLMKATKTDFCLLDNLSGTLRPGRITLLLGPPGAGKSTLLNALAGGLQKATMKVSRPSS